MKILAGILIIGVFIILSYLVLLWFLYYVAGGNWLKEEGQYVRWRHYMAVKLKLVKPKKPAQSSISCVKKGN